MSFAHGKYWCLKFTYFHYSLEKAMAPHSSTLAWKIPWMEEPGRLQSMRSLRVGHDWVTSLSLFSFIREGNGNPLQCSCLENLRDGGARWAAVYGVTQSRTRLKWLSSSSNVHVTTTRLWTLCVQPITRFWNRTTHKVKPLSCVLFFATPWTLGY